MNLKKNDLVTITIDDMGNEGEGIGKADGFTLFVKDSVIGDIVQVRITKIKKNYGYGKVEKVETPSSFRVEPPCRYSRQCGGCQIQAYSYEKQLEFKENKVRNNLIRIGGFEPAFINQIMEPIVGMEEPWHYRNKAQYPVGTDREGNIITGFYAGRTHSIIANTDCLLGDRKNKEYLEVILAYMKQERVAAYDEATGRGLLRHILIRTGFTSKEVMICLIINKELKDKEGQNCENGQLPEKILPNLTSLLERLKKYSEIKSICINCNTEKTNVIMGPKTYTLYGKDVISDTIHVRNPEDSFSLTGEEIVYQISAKSFYQVNPIQTEKLYSLALSYAALTGKETVWDLYCGIGTISLFLAQKAKQVYGVEILPEATADASRNAKNNGITNAEFYTGKAEEVLPRLLEEEGIYADVMVVDPPRKGCDEACLETMLKMKPEKIVYVSCDSATLARDLKVLCEGGYELKKVRAVDQFGHTVHVETVCLLSKLHEAKHHVSVTVDMDEMDLTAAESKATYEEIKEYVLKQTGLKVSSLNIAQVKKKCGIELRENYNLSKSENAKQPKCPLDKEKAIKDTLEHLGMI